MINNNNQTEGQPALFSCDPMGGRHINIFLAGPMTGHPDLNYALFRRWESLIREAVPCAHIVSLMGAPRGLPPHQYTVWANQFIRHSQLFIVIGDEKTELSSRGLRDEIALAKARNLPLFYTKNRDVETLKNFLFSGSCDYFLK